MKKENYTSIWLLVLVILLITLIVWGLFFVHETNYKISIFGIVAVVVAAFTSVLTVNINNYKTREREYELHILKEKQKVCEHFYNAFFESLTQIINGKDGLSKKALEETMLFRKGLMNWGSERIIQKYLNYDESLIENQGNTKLMFNKGNEFLLELRKELGFQDSGKVNLMSILLTAEARKEILK